MSDFDALVKNLASDELLPIPNKEIKPKSALRKENKHDRAYNEYCKWSALPTSVRDPKTEVAFEKKWELPTKYSANNFRKREDFNARRLKYFWEWTFDVLPEVVYKQYRLAVDKSNTSAAKFFADLVSQRLDFEKPQERITNINLIGVSQDKIDKLFIPKDYEDAVVVKNEETKIPV